MVEEAGIIMFSLLYNESPGGFSLHQPRNCIQGSPMYQLDIMSSSSVILVIFLS